MLPDLNRLRLPDLWQQEAVQALREGRDVILDAPTGAGKTYVFELVARDLSKQGQCVYTVPTRALANDKFVEWRREGWKVGIATGDVAESVDAPVLVATLETQRERLLRGDGPRLLAVDEYQMLGDPVRGLNYETALALAPSDTQLLLLSGSVANPDEIAGWLRRLGRDAVVVRTPHRPVPLDDLHVAGLPRQAPRRVDGFFPRMAAAACLSSLAPLLIFAPQRASAERIARQVAASLPDDLPLKLEPEHAALCPAEMRGLLERRIAYHHSGLPYPVRAGLVEPLAKSGQLRVIVATMGLAAGINFSVRSVFVSSRTYRHGPWQKEVRADELLQMFGRAGRRGLDESGAVLTSDNTPRLADGRPARLQRHSVVDWPTLLRVMAQASDTGDCPFAAASRLAASLFSGVAPRLGWEATTEEAASASPAEDAPFTRAPQKVEMLNSTGQWQRRPDASSPRPLARCLARHGDAWTPALRVPGIIAAMALSGARPIKLTPAGDPTRWRYGLEMAVATRLDDGAWKPTRATARLAWLKRGTTFTAEQWEAGLRKRVVRSTGGAAYWDEAVAGPTLRLRLDIANLTIEAWEDEEGAWLIDPPLRQREAIGGTAFTDPEDGATRAAPPGTPLHAWRRLELIEADGSPTLRGRIMSFFQGGEGLAIAAALEDTTYPVEDLAWDVANLRAGHRFAETATGESARLGAACRRAYGSLDFPGYLDLGLPPGFGEGAGDHLRRHCLSERTPAADLTDDLRPGDLERARVEWASLLRHIAEAPALGHDRWEALQAVAAHLLHRFGPEVARIEALLRPPPSLSSPDLTIRVGRW